MELFEQFCSDYNLPFDFTKVGDQYKSYDTQKAYIIFRYADNFKNY